MEFHLQHHSELVVKRKSKYTQRFISKESSVFILVLGPNLDPTENNDRLKTQLLVVPHLKRLVSNFPAVTCVDRFH